MSSKIAEHRLPCNHCGSSDAYHKYDDGHGYCFSCKVYDPGKDKMELNDFSLQSIPWGELSASTLKAYGVAAKVRADGVPSELQFPYTKGTKHRLWSEKKFYASGDMSYPQLFGQDKFPAGSAKAITICEGEKDTLACFQIQGSKYPVVGVRSASSARQDCTEHFEYLNSFEQIYICMDNDDPGRKATAEIAALFDFNKVFHVKITKHKDVYDFLAAGEADQFRRVWWNSQKFLPDTIISSFTQIDDIIDSDEIIEGVSYPWPKLQQMTYGMRPGEFVLLTAQQGIGKTEFIRAIEHHVLKQTEHNVGIIHLEESKARAIKGLVGYELRQPVHLPDTQVSKEQIKETFRKITRNDNRVHLYSHFGSDDYNTILAMVQFLAGPCQCRFIFLDHISMVVSGTDLDDERRALDVISTRLKMMAEKLGVTIVVISHVNDDGLTRGSRNIAKVADLHVHLDRNPEHEDEEVRNTTALMIRKNRFGAHTGPAGKLKFNRDTFLLSPEEDEFGVPT